MIGTIFLIFLSILQVNGFMPTFDINGRDLFEWHMAILEDEIHDIEIIDDYIGSIDEYIDMIG